ncbi:hypothetical protein PE067_10750 [Paracoccus sp. DMF-8]|uniref:hypothetical protein n=1 Tax=Paracoccus sp. DMF-8 TaxID=3019445 RepID=UPI0023E7896E|nr:hypothetical protein [Paracoccus sp. DMF-8]MDF3606580.1 hypothetical protein [Paracoccus sp. DMF-8]
MTIPTDDMAAAGVDPTVIAAFDAVNAAFSALRNTLKPATMEDLARISAEVHRLRVAVAGSTGSGPVAPETLARIADLETALAAALARIEALEGGETPQPGVAPSLVTAGVISPVTGPFGTVFDLTAPVFSGTPTPTVTRSATFDGQPVALVGDSFVGTGPGELVVTWTASNGYGAPAVSTASATITAALTSPVVTDDPAISPAPATGGTSTLDIGAATGSPAPEATWVAQIDGWPDQTGTGGGLIVWPEVSADTAWTVTVTWANGVGDPAAVTLEGTIIADAPEPPAEWTLTGGAGEIIITAMPAVPALIGTGGEGEITIEE